MHLHLPSSQPDEQAQGQENEQQQQQQQQQQGSQGRTGRGADEPPVAGGQCLSLKLGVLRTGVYMGRCCGHFRTS